MPISQKIRDLIYSAWADGSPCLLATQGPNGPNISPKGSMPIFDDEHLAYWERSKRQALENIGHDRRVAVMYSNFKAQRCRVCGATYGTATNRARPNQNRGARQRYSFNAQSNGPYAHRQRRQARAKSGIDSAFCPSLRRLDRLDVRRPPARWMPTGIIQARRIVSPARLCKTSIPKTCSIRIGISGLDAVMADAISFKFLHEPLTKEQLSELFQVPQRQN